MKLQDKTLSVKELVALRQWFAMWESSMRLDMKYVQQAREALIYIDKALWSELVSNETPWGTVGVVVKDEKFEETIQELFGDANKPEQL